MNPGRQDRRLDSSMPLRNTSNLEGNAIVNVLIEGTTYLGMFDPDDNHLFGQNELGRAISRLEHPAITRGVVFTPVGTRKKFLTSSRRNRVENEEL
jgi:hypothetical protein